MVTLLLRFLVSNLVVLLPFAWFVFVSGLDAALTKTDHMVKGVYLITPYIHYILFLAWFIALKDVFISPIMKSFDYNKSFLKGGYLHRNHKLRTTFRLCHFKAGWFGILKLARINGNYHIAINAGGIWDGYKYVLNPLFVSYLVRFRGYRKSLNGEYLLKPIR